MNEAQYRLGRWQDTLIGAYDETRAVVITDPPFGLGDQGDKGYSDEIPWAVHVTEVLDLLPARRHVFRGPGREFVQRAYPQPRRILIEAADFRGAGLHPGSLPYRYHGWFVYGSLKIGYRRLAPTSDWFQISPYGEARDRETRPSSRDHDHGGITPYQAAVHVVELFTEPGWIVIDPFAGMGTIGRAAAALGHPSLGAEINEQYHAEAVAAPAIRMRLPFEASRSDDNAGDLGL